jgi:hypothetical protein
LIFVVVAAAGFVLTGVWVASYRKQLHRTANGQAIVISSGLTLTWFASILAPFLASPAGAPTKTTIMFAAGLSLSTGIIAYVATRLVLWLTKKRSA